MTAFPSTTACRARSCRVDVVHGALGKPKSSETKGRNPGWHAGAFPTGCSSPDLAPHGTGPGTASSVRESSPNRSFPQSHAFSLSPLRVSPCTARAGAGEANLLHLKFFQPSCFAGCCFGATFRWCLAAHREQPPTPGPLGDISRNIQTLVPPSEMAALAGVVAGG